MIQPFKKLSANVLEVLLHEIQYIVRVLRLVECDASKHNVLRGAPMSYMLLHDAQANIMCLA